MCRHCNVSEKRRRKIVSKENNVQNNSVIKENSNNYNDLEWERMNKVK